MLGIPDLKVCPVDGFVSASIRHCYYTSSEPEASLVALAALGVSCSGPKWWPKHDGRKPWADYGRDVHAAVAMHSVPPGGAVTAGRVALNRMSKQDDITEEEVNACYDFFGIPLPSLTDSGSASDTAEGEPSTD